MRVSRGQNFLAMLYVYYVLLLYIYIGFLDNYLYKKEI